MLQDLLLGVLARYAAAMVAAAATSAATFAMTQWGLSAGAVSIAGSGLVIIGIVLVLVVSKNKNAKAIIDRLPVRDMLKAAADATKADVAQIVLRDPALADAIPSPKVVSINQVRDPAGNGNVSG